MTDRRIVITGTGVVSSVGSTVASFWDSLLTGKSGLGRVTQFNVDTLRSQIAGEISGFSITDYIDQRDARRLDPFCHYAIGASFQAMKAAGMDLTTGEVDPTRVGVLVGSGIGGLSTMQEQFNRLFKFGPTRISPFLIPMMIGDMASGAVSMQLGARGPNFGIVSACATGTHSIGEAYWIIKRGDADAMIAGGAEASVNEIGLGGFCAMKAMSEQNAEPTKASCPFDRRRDGFVISEGAGVVVLETAELAKKRGVPILAEVVGYGASADAHHITAPCPDGGGAIQAIRMAMNHAKLNAEDVGYINAHGTSTPLNDKFETMAIKSVFGERAYKIPVSSTKSLTGHALGAAGGLETVVCVNVLNEGVIPGTYNYEEPDPDCDLDYVPNQTREQNVDVALNMNFGFGGHNAVLALKKYID